MRVIAGVARGRPLAGPPGPQTRPTSDKVKGALFSMLEALLATERPGLEGEEVGVAEPGSPELWHGLWVLDLYAGTGALGIEALSRGAAWCDFVESNAAARRVIERNLRVTGLADRARIIGLDAEKFARGATRVSTYEPYGVSLMDPPYNDPRVNTVIGDLAKSGLLARRALVAVEHSRRMALSDAYDGLALVRERRHGDTILSIYRNGASADPGAVGHGHNGDLSRNL